MRSHAASWNRMLQPHEATRYSLMKPHATAIFVTRYSLMEPHATATWNHALQPHGATCYSHMKLHINEQAGQGSIGTYISPLTHRGRSSTGPCLRPPLCMTGGQAWVQGPPARKSPCLARAPPLAGPRGPGGAPARCRCTRPAPHTCHTCGDTSWTYRAAGQGREV